MWILGLKGSQNLPMALLRGTIYSVSIANVWVYGWNPMLCSFKWNLFCTTFTWFWIAAGYKTVADSLYSWLVYFGHFDRNTVRKKSGLLKIVPHLWNEKTKSTNGLMAMKNCKWNEMPLRELEIIIIKQLILFQVQAKWRKVLIEDFKMSFYGICYSCVTLIIFRFLSFFFLSSVLLETKINTCVTNSRLKQNTVSPLGTWWEV